MGFTSELVALGSLAVAGVVWLVRLEGRVGAQARELQMLDQTHNKDLEQLRADIRYIRERIDRALGAR